MSKNRKFAYFLAAGIAVCGAGFLFRTPSASRTLSSQLVMHDHNVATLRAIPLVKGLERADEEEDEITSDLIGIFSKFASRNASPDGTLHRGTHSKGKCFKGQIEILSPEQLHAQGLDAGATARLKRGIWVQSGPFSTVIRFANADGLGRAQPDTTPDVRGFSFSLRGITGLDSYSHEGRQDFMMNSTAGFASGGIHEFAEVVKLANIAVYHDFHFPPNPFYLRSAARDLELINQGNSEGANLRSFAHTEYWGNLPYTHGLAPDGTVLDIVKYKATPCDGQHTQHIPTTDGLAADYLQTEISTAAREGSVCMLIQLQYFDSAAMHAAASANQAQWTPTDWVEEGGLEWSEKILPFHTIARITIPGGENPEISCDDQYINTRLHSNPANQPVGSIARVRTLIEENSRAERMAR